MSSAFLYLGNTGQDSLQIRIQFKAIYTWAFGFIYISSHTTAPPSSFNNTLLLVRTSFSYTIRYRIFEHDSNSTHFHSLLPTSTSTLQHFNTSTLQYFNTYILPLPYFHFHTSTSTLPLHFRAVYDSDSIRIYIYSAHFTAFFCHIISQPHSIRTRFRFIYAFLIL
jgi:hypothetical protein